MKRLISMQNRQGHPLKDNTYHLEHQVFKHAVRQISTTNVDPSQSLVKMKRLQAKFQCDDGKPVWLKGGFYDRILYSTTIVLCLIGIGMDLAFYFNQAKPPSWKNPVC